MNVCIGTKMFFGKPKSPLFGTFIFKSPPQPLRFSFAQASTTKLSLEIVQITKEIHSHTLILFTSITIGLR